MRSAITLTRTPGGKEDGMEENSGRKLPKDAAVVDAQCDRSTVNGQPCENCGFHEAIITASVSLGQFQIWDMKTNVVLTVALQDAIAAILDATSRAHSLETAAKGAAQYADQTVAAPAV